MSIASILSCPSILTALSSALTPSLGGVNVLYCNFQNTFVGTIQPLDFTSTNVLTTVVTPQKPGNPIYAVAIFTGSASHGGALVELTISCGTSITSPFCQLLTGAPNTRSDFGTSSTLACCMTLNSQNVEGPQTVNLKVKSVDIANIQCSSNNSQSLLLLEQL